MFKAHVLKVVPFGHSREEIASAVADLNDPDVELPKDSNGTALIENLGEALKLLGHPRLGDTVFFITDGSDSIRKTTPADFEDEMIAEGVRMSAYLMLVPGRDFPTEEERNGRVEFLSLIKNTGGTIDQVQHTTEREKAEFERALKEAYRAIADFYRLEVQLPEGVLPDKKIRVNIFNSLGKAAREYRVAYPVKLGNCQPDSR